MLYAIIIAATAAVAAPAAAPFITYIYVDFSVKIIARN